MTMVSVVVTAYNYAEFLPCCLESVLGQTHADLDVVVVDDGSTDNTRQVVEPYLADARLRYVYQENAGQSSAKNRGVRESRSELVAFVDADDVCLPERIARQLPLFDDPEVGVGYARRRIVDAQNRQFPFDHPTLYRGRVLDRIYAYNFICFSSSMVRKSVFEAAGGFDESLKMGVDYDLWTRMAARCAFDYVDEELVLYRAGHGNMSTHTEKRLRSTWRIMQKNLRRPEVRAGLSRAAVGESRARLLRSLGRLRAGQGRIHAAAACFAGSLLLRPHWPETWKIIAKCALPEKTVEWCRLVRDRRRRA